MNPIYSKRVTAAGALTDSRIRVFGLYVMCGASAGRVTIKDGGSGGTIIFDIDTPADATKALWLGPFTGGIVAVTNAYLSAATNVTSVTAFLG